MKEPWLQHGIKAKSPKGRGLRARRVLFHALKDTFRWRTITFLWLYFHRIHPHTGEARSAYVALAHWQLHQIWGCAVLTHPLCDFFHLRVSFDTPSFRIQVHTHWRPKAELSFLFLAAVWTRYVFFSQLWYIPNLFICWQVTGKLDLVL